MIKYARHGLPAAALAAGLASGATAVAPPASAGVVAGRCGENHACGYDGTHYRGTEFFDKSVRHLMRINIPNDRLESVSNRTDYNLCLYDYWGRQMTVPPHSGVRDIGRHKNHTDYVYVSKAGQTC